MQNTLKTWKLVWNSYLEDVNDSVSFSPCISFWSGKIIVGDSGACCHVSCLTSSGYCCILFVGSSINCIQTCVLSIRSRSDSCCLCQASLPFFLSMALWTHGAVTNTCPACLLTLSTAGLVLSVSAASQNLLCQWTASLNSSLNLCWWLFWLLVQIASTTASLT